MEGFKFGLGIADARQKFKFRPNSSLVPGGGWIVEQRLWYVRLEGSDVFCSFVRIAVLKFLCRVFLGSLMYP
jgi:hypothetical protein